MLKVRFYHFVKSQIDQYVKNLKEFQQSKINYGVKVDYFVEIQFFIQFIS
jgi:hypothetical protein